MFAVLVLVPGFDSLLYSNPFSFIMSFYEALFRGSFWAIITFLIIIMLTSCYGPSYMRCTPGVGFDSPRSFTCDTIICLTHAR